MCAISLGQMVFELLFDILLPWLPILIAELFILFIEIRSKIYGQKALITPKKIAS